LQVVFDVLLNGALLKKVLPVLKGDRRQLTQEPHLLGQQKLPVGAIPFYPFCLIPLAEQQV
jgi:hypothetical protein